MCKETLLQRPIGSILHCNLHQVEQIVEPLVCKMRSGITTRRESMLLFAPLLRTKQRRTMIVFGAMLVVLLCEIPRACLASSTATAATSTRSSEMDEKEPIQKGDDECPSLAERYNDYRINGNDNTWLKPCVESDVAPAIEVPKNGISIEFYATLPAYADSFGAYKLMPVMVLSVIRNYMGSVLM
jgi:hypothetical protein